jgi:hypothetical protein
VARTANKATHDSLYLVAQHFIHTGGRGPDTRENALNPVLKLVDRAYGEVVAGLVIFRLLVGLGELFFQVADGLFALGVAGRVLWCAKEVTTTDVSEGCIQLAA